MGRWAFGNHVVLSKCGNAMAFKVQECTEEDISTIGMKRASKFGWQDTYVFTKAMGEMLLVRDRGQIPLVFVRPSIVESSHREPFPGNDATQACLIVCFLLSPLGVNYLHHEDFF